MNPASQVYALALTVVVEEIHPRPLSHVLVGPRPENFQSYAGSVCKATIAAMHAVTTTANRRIVDGHINHSNRRVDTSGFGHAQAAAFARPERSARSQSAGGHSAHSITVSPIRTRYRMAVGSIVAVTDTALRFAISMRFLSITPLRAFVDTEFTGYYTVCLRRTCAK
jgi:hypothetical protein